MADRARLAGEPLVDARRIGRRTARGKHFGNRIGARGVATLVPGTPGPVDRVSGWRVE
jgi:hypothetical protein